MTERRQTTTAVRQPAEVVHMADRSRASLAVPMVGSVLLTYGVVWWICATPYHASLGWLAWVRTGMDFLVVAFVAHGLAIWLNRRLFRGEVDAPTPWLVVAAWPVVVWVPLLVLLLREQSVWSVMVPAVVVLSTASALDGWAGPRRLFAEGPTVATLFQGEDRAPFLGAIAPALVCSAAAHAAVVETVRGDLVWAGWLVAGCVGLCRWRYPGRGSPVRSDAARWRPLLPRTVAVWLLLLVALLPYVGSKRLALAFEGVLGTRPPARAVAKKSVSERSRDGSYSGVILLFAAKSRHEAVTLPRQMIVSRTGFRERRPVVIPFDGAYWYFKSPAQRPRADAPVVRGDPRRKTIRSTDFRPLVMEAHQRIDPPVPMDCCRALRLQVQNVDAGQGPIALEVLLRDRDGSAPATVVSLGTQILPSSTRPQERAASPLADEALTFLFPGTVRRGGLRRFDEIAVTIRPRSDRARAGAHVAIESFELLP